MNRKDNIEKLAEDALQSMDNAARATPLPWLLNRVNKRLGNYTQSTWDKAGTFISRPVIAVPALVLVVLLNAAVIFISKADNSATVTEQLSMESTDDLQLSVASFYDIVNAAP